jgi:hypothetical protein
MQDDAPSYEELAERCLDLWQEDCAAAARDPEIVALLARLLRSAGPEGFAAALSAWPGLMTGKKP